MRVVASIDEGRALLARQFVEKRLGKKWSDLSSQEKIQAIYNLQRGCRCCELYLGKYKPVPSVLNPGSKYLFIGRSPNEGEAQHSKLYPRDTNQGKCLEAYLRTLGIAQGECSFLNCAQCWSEGGYSLTSEHVSICSFFKSLELEVIGNDFQHIFLLGDTAIRWFFGPNAPGLVSANGVSFKVQWLGRERMVHQLYHSSYIVIRPDLKPDLGNALKSVRDLIHPQTQNKEK